MSSLLDRLAPIDRVLLDDDLELTFTHETFAAQPLPEPWETEPCELCGASPGERCATDCPNHAPVEEGTPR
jgi:hypothetical protein